MFVARGSAVLIRRNCGSKMRAWPAVVKSTSPVRAREILNENGAALYVNLICAASGRVIESAAGRGRTEWGTS